MRKATTTEIIAMNKLLGENLTKLADGRVHYLEAWSDERVAKEVNEELSSNTARRIRQEVYGKLKRSPSTGTVATRLDTLTEKHNQLCDRLVEFAGNKSSGNHFSALQFVPCKINEEDGS